MDDRTRIEEERDDLRERLIAIVDMVDRHLDVYGMDKLQWLFEGRREWDLADDVIDETGEEKSPRLEQGEMDEIALIEEFVEYQEGRGKKCGFLKSLLKIIERLTDY